MQIISNLVEAHIFRIADSGIEFLLMKRAESEIYPNIWQMVTGSIENEKAYETAIREIIEETGLAPKLLWVVPRLNSFYSHEKDYICMIPVFVGMVSESADVKISSEHSEFKWVDAETAKKMLAWKGQRESVSAIYEFLTDKSSSLKFIEIPLTQI